MSIRAIISIKLCVLAAASAFAQPVLIKDVNTGPTSSIHLTSNQQFCQSGAILFFRANSAGDIQADDLWRTDGTAGGTVNITEHVSLAANRVDGPMADLNSKLIFTVEPPDADGLTGSGYSLWETDGTSEGTKLIATPKYQSTPLRMQSMIAQNNRIIFMATNAAGYIHIGISDGTSNGTSAFKKLDLNPNAIVYQQFEATSNYVYFKVRFNDAVTGNPTISLWRTNGTEVGTISLAENIGGEDYTEFRAVGDKLYFSKGDNEIWTTDGTPGGTNLLFNMNGANFVEFFPFNNKMIISGDETWISDGTPGGTSMLIDTYISGESVIFNSKLYAVKGSSPKKLISTDGTMVGTTEVAAVGSKFPEMKVLNGKIILAFDAPGGGTELGTSDGVSSSITMLKDILPGPNSSNPKELEVFNNKVVFVADDGLHGVEPWVSNGTEAGTLLMKDLATKTLDGAPDYSPVYKLSNNKFFFSYNDLWTITDEPLGATIAIPGFSTNIGMVDDKLFLAAFKKIMVTNGTDGGILLRDYGTASAATGTANDAVTKLGDKYIFPYSIRGAGTENIGSELWISDGTQVGTHPIKDINPGTANGARLSKTKKLNETTVVFAANNGVNGIELWKTDGTEAGTLMIKDINGGSAGSLPDNFFADNGIAYFTASSSAGVEVWKTDGTEAGTTMLKDINTNGSSSPGWFAKLGNSIYFVALGTNGGWGLWKTNGTEAGTMMIKQISTTDNSANIQPWVSLAANKLYFPAWSEAGGKELWVTDGTVDGTISFDLVPGVASSDPVYFAPAERGIYFRANNQLWRSGGTANTTQKLSDINPGYISYIDGVLYFPMDSELYGTEMFKYVPSEFPKQDQTISFTLNDHAFEDGSFPLAATSSSSLAVSFTTTTLEKITISGQTATIKKAGKATIKVTQAGDNLYNATSTEATICINPSKPIVHFTTQITGQFNASVTETEGVQWFFNGEPITGSTGQTPSKTDATGNYSAQVTIEGCKSPMSDLVPYVYTGIEDEIPGLSIYPNPAHDILYIQSPSNAQLRITNVIGQSMAQQNFNGVIEIPLTPYSPGIYVARITVDDKVAVKRFVKE